MARALVIEEEQGTCRAHLHPHNGYYAGDFGSRSTAPTRPVTTFAATSRPAL